MTSRILSLLRLFGPRGVTTPAQPNAWAIVSQWRHYFEWKQEEEEELQRELEEQILNEILDNKAIRPIAQEPVRRARREVVAEYYDELKYGSRNLPPTMQPSRRTLQVMMEQERQQLERPNQDILVGGDYMTLPQ